MSDRLAKLQRLAELESDPARQQKIARLIELEQSSAQEPNVTYADPDRPAQAFTEGLGQTATFGYLPQLQAVASKAIYPAMNAITGQDVQPDSYVEERDRNIERQASLQRSNPLANLLGKLGGVAASAKAIPGGVKMPTGFVQGAKQAAKIGGGVGAAYNPGDERGVVHNPLEGDFQAVDRVSGAVTGAALGAPLGGAGGLVSKGARLSRTIPLVKDEEALLRGTKTSLEGSAEKLTDKIRPLAQDLRQFLTGKEVEVPPARLKGVDPKIDRYVDIQANRQGRFVPEGPDQVNVVKGKKVVRTEPETEQMPSRFGEAPAIPESVGMQEVPYHVALQSPPQGMVKINGKYFIPAPSTPVKVVETASEGAFTPLKREQPQTIKIDANTANMLKRRLDRASNYPTGTIADPATEARIAKAERAARPLRGELEALGPEVSQKNLAMQEAINARSNVSKGARRDPISTIKPPTGSTKKALLRISDRLTGDDLVGQGERIQSAQDLLIPQTMATNMLQWPSLAGRAVTRGALGTMDLAEKVTPPGTLYTILQAVNEARRKK